MATTQSEAKQANTQPGANCGGIAINFRWVNYEAAVKRLRRHLAKSGEVLIKSKPRTKAWAELGEFAIKDTNGDLIGKSLNLESALRARDLLNDSERVEYPYDRGWLFYVSRQKTVIIDGQEYIHLERVSRDYTTEKAARNAAKSFENREGLGISGWDAARF